jgi:hypothetical protein
MLKQIRCVADTEGGGESPYLLVFMGTRITSGSATPPGQLVRARVPEWDNAFNPGVTKNIEMILFQNEAGGNFVFATLLEEDFDPDLGSGTVMQLLFQGIWNKYGSSAWGNLSSSQLQEIVRGKIRDLIQPMLSNDEYLGVRSLVVPTVTDDTLLPEMRFTGDGGDFRVRLGVRIKGG